MRRNLCLPKKSPLSIQRAFFPAWRRRRSHFRHLSRACIALRQGDQPGLCGTASAQAWLTGQLPALPMMLSAGACARSFSP